MSFVFFALRLEEEEERIARLGVQFWTFGMKEIPRMDQSILSNDPFVGEIIDDVLHLLIVDLSVQLRQISIEVFPLFKWNASISTRWIAGQQFTDLRQRIGDILKSDIERICSQGEKTILRSQVSTPRWRENDSIAHRH